MNYYIFYHFPPQQHILVLSPSLQITTWYRTRHLVSKISEGMKEYREISEINKVIFRNIDINQCRN